ncbi:MAG: ATP-binding protein [Proteobacteria bacterium]|nr:ATP-binding protein [Pseudomonadota bacterium]MBU1712923.1 ATP-binding protein [Pseudomonadota bacterium]
MDISATITIPAKLEFLYESVDFVSSCAREQKFSNEKISEIALVIEEVFVNISKYAYAEKNDHDANIEITCKSVETKGFVIEIVDSGVPFDIMSVREPDLTSDINGRQTGGLGILFIKKLMYEVQYRREEGRNKLTLFV